MRKVKIGMIQIKSKLLDIKYNTETAIRLIRNAALNGAEVVCLPECFETGYNIDVMIPVMDKISEYIDGTTVTKLSMIAKELKIYIIAGVILKGDKKGTYYNSAVVINTVGEVIGTYNKNHLFGDEKRAFSLSSSYPVFDTDFGKVGVIICYDNNFPEPARILSVKGAEIIFCLCAWRIQEKDIYDLMISSHACENTVYFCAVNQFSRTEELYLFGNSKISDPRGRIIAEIENPVQDVKVAEIDLDNVSLMRKSMPFMIDRHPLQYGELSE